MDHGLFLPLYLLEQSSDLMVPKCIDPSIFLDDQTAAFRQGIVRRRKSAIGWSELVVLQRKPMRTIDPMPPVANVRSCAVRPALADVK